MFVQRCIRSVVVVEHEHVDEVDEDARGFPGHVHIVVAPFENDHENQVSKQAQHKNHLGNKLQNDVERLPEVSGGGKYTHTRVRRNTGKYQELIVLPKAQKVHCIRSPGKQPSCTGGGESACVQKSGGEPGPRQWSPTERSRSQAADNRA